MMLDEFTPIPPKHLILKKKTLWGLFLSIFFKDKRDSFATIVFFFLFSLFIYLVFNWLLFDAVFTAGSSAKEISQKCQVALGACWPFIAENFTSFIYGFYPEEYQWRINLSAVILMLLFALLFIQKMRWYIVFLLIFIFPIVVNIILFFGIQIDSDVFSIQLPAIKTNELSGFSLTLFLSFFGILLAFPLGLILSLMRISKKVPFRYFSAFLTDFFRGSPLIALLFMASVMLPFFFPINYSVDLLWRVLIIIVLFEAAYISEAIRGGLQSISSHQYEAARSLGLNYFYTMSLIILPQAIRVAIPGIVNVFIALFKDTTLVAIIGMFEFVRFSKNSLLDTKWIFDASLEVYLFIAFLFWVFCFLMSRLAHIIEKGVSKGYE